MMLSAQAFIKEVQELYVKHPCQVSSIAFWKLASICLESQTYRLTDNGHTYLYAIRQQRLEFYWSDDRDRFILPSDRIQALQFLVLHDDFYRLIAGELKGYQVEESHPLIYDFAFAQSAIDSEDYDLADFDFDQDDEFVAAAALLNRCYENASYQVAAIASWCRQPVFDHKLWFWVRSRNAGERVGLGISTYQESIRETYLDWIQVLPTHRKKGLGRMLVGETINRAVDRSDIIRVTGMADGFYEKCGFGSTERWRIISSRED